MLISSSTGVKEGLENAIIVRIEPQLTSCNMNTGIVDGNVPDIVFKLHMFALSTEVLPKGN